MSAPGTGGHQSPISLHGEDARPSPGKRKAEGESIIGNPIAPRAKRNRYISIACNECKRRKIKCNGETPCQRCGNLSLECVYAPNCCSNGFKDSDEYRQVTSHLQSLQDQVNTLFANVAELQTKPAGGTVNINGVGGIVGEVAQPNGTVDPQFAFQATPVALRRSSDPHGEMPRAYSGPASSSFYLDHTNGNMRPLGIEPNSVDDNAPSLPPPKPVLNSSPADTDVAHPSASVIKDPLWDLSLDESLRLCRVFSEQFGSVYPILDVEKATNKARTMWSFLDSMRRVGLMQKESERGDSFCDNETLVLKMIMALATSREDQAERALGQSLFENVRRIVNGEDRLGGPATIVGLQLWVLISFFYLKCGAELQAYRTIGMAARQCFEIGLHRSEIIASMFDTPECVRAAVRLFWIIYIFDNQFSMLTGLPVAFREADLDPNLPQLDESYPYARAMLCYCKIASHIWAPVAGFEHTGMMLKLDDMSWIDWQISQWSGAIPEELRFTHLDFSLSLEEMSRTQKRLRVKLYLRGNQLRLQLYRPVFYSTTSALENRGYASTVVEIAKDNIRTISELDKATDLFQTEPLSFHYYLVTALSVLFLAVAQTPVEFSRQVRDEFYLALDLIKTAEKPSVPLQRLGRTIVNLRRMVPKLEALSPNHPALNSLVNGKEQAPSAAVGMVGLPGHAMDDSQHWNAPAHAETLPGPLTGPQMSYEMMNLFEAACRFGEVVTKHEELIINGIDTGTTLETFAGLWRGNDPTRGEAEFAKAMKDIF